jgi:hypothetical protein
LRRGKAEQLEQGRDEIDQAHVARDAAPDHGTRGAGEATQGSS